jgi:hypothetical protein
MLRRKRAPKPLEPWKGPKPKLQMQVAYLCRVHYLDLQVYLAKVYRMRDYDLLESTGAIGVFPEYLVTGKLPAASNVDQQANDIRRGRRTRDLGFILNVLCADGFIPVGQYVIDTRFPPNLIKAYTDLLNRHHDPKHPECMAFKRKYRNPEFLRRAKDLDRIVRTFQDEEEKTADE